MTADLAAAILAAVEADEAVAREAAESGVYTSCDWWAKGSWWLEGNELLTVGKGDAGADVIGYFNDESVRVHIARHDPARVLAMCAGVRAVVELHTPDHRGDHFDPTCTDLHETPGVLPDDCPTLVALASAYGVGPAATDGAGT